MLPTPSVPDEEEIYLAELTPLENLAVFEAVDDFPTIPAPPPEHF
jgi:hypothetical protein